MERRKKAFIAVATSRRCCRYRGGFKGEFMKVTRMAWAVALLLACAVFASCASTAKVETITSKAAATGKVVESYIRTWPISTAEGQSFWTADDIKGELLTQLIVSFAHVDGNTADIYFPDADNAETPFIGLWTEVAKLQAKYPELNCVVSIGGWGADGFSKISADDALRAQFVANIVDLVKAKNLNGIDIDWEYPVGPDWGQEITSSPDDAKNFLKLLAQIRVAFDMLERETGAHYSLSCAIPASTWYPAKLDVVAISQLVDIMKLMTYDYYGAWSSTTGHIANIYVNPADPAWGGWSTAQTVDMYLTAGVPAEKMVVGLAFYSFSWTGVPAGENNGLFMTPGAAGTNNSWPEVKAMLESGEYTRYWDDVAKAPYLYNGDTFVSYTDAEAIAAIRDFVEEKGLAGYMVWEYGWDLSGELFELLSE